MSEFIQNCDRCSLDLEATDRAFDECNRSYKASNDNLIEAILVSGFVGFLLGKVF